MTPNNQDRHIAEELNGLLNQAQSREQSEEAHLAAPEARAEAETAARVREHFTAIQADPDFVAALEKQLTGAGSPGLGPGVASNEAMEAMIHHAATTLSGPPASSPRHGQSQLGQPRTRSPIIATLRQPLVALSSLVTLVILIVMALALWPLLSQGRIPDVEPDVAPTPIPAPTIQPNPPADTRFADVSEFTLDEQAVQWPSNPARMPHYTWTPRHPYTLDEIKQLAQHFGLSNTRVYTRADRGGEERYYVRDGGQQLEVSGALAAYTNNGDGDSLDLSAMLPYTRAAVVAEQFLRQRGLLQGEWLAMPAEGRGQATTVSFVPLLSGYPAVTGGTEGAISALVDHQDQVIMVVYAPVTFQSAGEAEVRPARAAWDDVLAGRGTVIPQAAPGGRATSGRIWLPQYRSGEQADVFGRLDVFMPADGTGSPAYFLSDQRPVLLSGGIDKVTALKPDATADDLVHAWGTMRQEDSGQWVMDVSGAEVVTDGSAVSFEGEVRTKAGLVSVETSDGKTYALAHAPGSLPEGQMVSAIGYPIGKTGDGLPVIGFRALLQPVSSTTSADGAGEASVATHPGELAVSQDFAQPGPPAYNPLPEMTPTATADVAATDESQSGDASEAATVLPAGTPTPVPLGQMGVPARPYQHGQRVQGLSGRAYVNVYESADGKTRQVQAMLNVLPEPQARLATREWGWSAFLTGTIPAEIEQYHQRFVRVWGRFMEDTAGNAWIVVDQLEQVDPEERIQAWAGTILSDTVEGRMVLLFNPDAGGNAGGPYLLMTSLSQQDEELNYYLTNYGGKQIIVEGSLQQQSIGGYRLLNNTAMDISKGDEQPGLAGYKLVSATPSVVRLPAPESRRGIVEQVALVYWQAQPQTLVPAWRFSGHTTAGVPFDVYVPAH